MRWYGPTAQYNNPHTLRPSISYLQGIWDDKQSVFSLAFLLEGFTTIHSNDTVSNTGQSSKESDATLKWPPVFTGMCLEGQTKWVTARDVKTKGNGDTCVKFVLLKEKSAPLIKRVRMKIFVQSHHFQYWTMIHVHNFPLGWQLLPLCSHVSKLEIKLYILVYKTRLIVTNLQNFHVPSTFQANTQKIAMYSTNKACSPTVRRLCD